MLLQKLRRNRVAPFIRINGAPFIPALLGGRSIRGLVLGMFHSFHTIPNVYTFPQNQPEGIQEFYFKVTALPLYSLPPLFKKNAGINGDPL